MRKQILKYTRLNVAERRGVIAMLALGNVFFLAAFVIRRLDPPKQPDMQLLSAKSASLLSQMETQPSIASTEAETLFAFDPNTVSIEQLQQLGLPQWLASRIDNYRNKGGQFRSADDFAKIYGISPEQVDRLRPFMRFESEDADIAERPNWNKKDQTAQVPKVILVAFDPNTASPEILAGLGMPERTVHSIVQYRTKGGRFRTAPDLKKIYTLSEGLYAKLEPYIRIEEAPVPVTYNTPKSEPPKTAAVIVDINLSDETVWQKIPGIGPAYAKKIVNYREKLGGFVDVEMVGKTYGLPDSVFQKIKPNLKASPITRKLQVNTADAQTIAKHPLFDFKQANLIANYRKQNGDLKSTQDLVAALPSVDKAWLRSVEPYLSFD